MENRQKRGLIVAFGALTCAAWAEPALAVKVARMRVLMGTMLHIEVIANDQGRAELAIESAFKKVAQLDQLLSNYKEDSEICRINREAYPKPLKVSAETTDFLARAWQLCDRTDGAFDFTVEPLTRLWNLRQRKLKNYPTPGEIEAARKKVNFRNVAVSDTDRTVRFLEPGMGIDTGGVGKGYALDLALREIVEYPVKSAVLNFGGEILYWTKEPEPRDLGIKDPLRPTALWMRVSLSTPMATSAVSTSANYERFVEYGSGAAGRKLSHILDPKSGHPVSNPIRSVTVIAANAAEADALSTAIFALGLEPAKKFANNLKESAVLILYEGKGGELQDFKSARWKESVTEE